jgi:hypothetical protein
MLRFRPLFGLFLSLALAATGLTLAAARGAAPAAGQVVLCSGGGLLVVSVDAEGNPTGKPHVCPDIALSLIATTALAAPDIRRPDTRRRWRPVPRPARRRAGRRSQAHRARGPPDAV